MREEVSLAREKVVSGLPKAREELSMTETSSDRKGNINEYI